MELKTSQSNTSLVVIPIQTLSGGPKEIQASIPKTVEKIVDALYKCFEERQIKIQIPPSSLGKLTEQFMSQLERNARVSLKITPNSGNQRCIVLEGNL